MKKVIQFQPFSPRSAVNCKIYIVSRATWSSLSRIFLDSTQYTPIHISTQLPLLSFCQGMARSTQTFVFDIKLYTFPHVAIVGTTPMKFIPHWSKKLSWHHLSLNKLNDTLHYDHKIYCHHFVNLDIRRNWTIIADFTVAWKLNGELATHTTRYFFVSFWELKFYIFKRCVPRWYKTFKNIKYKHDGTTTQQELLLRGTRQVMQSEDVCCDNQMKYLHK